MFYGNSIQDTRQFFFLSWEKYLQKKPLSALEQQLAQVILEHPEYHALFENPTLYQEQSYYPELGETNPFLHLGLHLSIREQVSTNRPLGIQEAFKRLVKKHNDPLHVEHLIMDQLAECLWRAQRDNLPPNEEDYLHSLAEL